MKTQHNPAAMISSTGTASADLPLHPYYAVWGAVAVLVLLVALAVLYFRYDYRKTLAKQAKALQAAADAADLRAAQLEWAKQRTANFPAAKRAPSPIADATKQACDKR